MNGYVFVITKPANPYFACYQLDFGHDYYIDGYVTKAEGRVSWGRRKKTGFPAECSAFHEGQWTDWC